MDGISVLRGWHKAKVVRASGKAPKDNPRFVVTNLPRGAEWEDERLYCSRGEIANRHKELHYSMEINPTSCTRSTSTRRAYS